jgi:FkbM family methyltransferase
MLRNIIRAKTPNAILHVYRPIRNLNRQLFRKFYDYRNAAVVKKLIVSRFPQLRSKLSHGVVLDLGANVGDFTHACLDLGFSVIAVEPHPSALKYLQRRMGKKPNVQILPVGVGDVEGKTFLYTHPFHNNDPIATSIAASTVSEKFSRGAMRFEIEIITLEKIMSNNEVFEIVKIDIEGAEMLLIDSIIHNAPKIKKLLVETHERFMLNTTESEKYYEALKKLNRFIHENNLEKEWLTDWI